MDEVLDPIVLCFADRLVEAAATTCRRNDVPQANASFRETFKSVIVIERVQILPGHDAEQSPELVGRVSIVTASRERGIARQAPQNEQRCVGPCNRGQTRFDAHELTPTAPHRETDRPACCPVFRQL